MAATNASHRHFNYHSRVKALLSAVLFAPLLFAQRTVPVTIMQWPEPGCPIVLSGHFTALHTGPDTYSGRAEMTAQNVSAKPILFFVVKESFDDGSAFVFQSIRSDEAFFHGELFAPGATRDVDEDIEPVTRSTHELRNPRQAPNARSGIAFVEFADGTYWGDLKIAEEFLGWRLAELKRFQELREIYRRKGEKPFVKELMQPTELPVVQSLQQVYNEGHDVAATVAQLDSLLANADRFHAALTPHR